MLLALVLPAMAVLPTLTCRRAAAPLRRQAPAQLNMPRHLAVIPDGNSRWAAREQKERIEGHWAGVDALRTLVESCARTDGIDVLTVYALSVENLQRPAAETRWLMQRPAIRTR